VITPFVGVIDVWLRAEITSFRRELAP